MEEMDTNTSVKVRLSTDLSAGEKKAIAARKKVVKKGLVKLKIKDEKGKIPTIAVLGSGGGLRAMIALFGTLRQLKDQNLLDCIMYLGGVSGSTWCMSGLYKQEDWSENMKMLEESLTETLTKGLWDYLKALEAAIEATKDKNYSLTDFWAFCIVYELLKQMDETKLSEQKESSENGKNPYPIYAAVDSNRYHEHKIGSWYEFTPHEVAIAGIGASIDIEHFGSEFENGCLKDPKKEKTICYLQDVWHFISETWHSVVCWKWGTTNNFLYNYSDVNYPELTKEPAVSLIDAGVAINTAYPLILRPERKVELILSFDFSAGDPFETLKKAAEYCKANELRFPKIPDNLPKEGQPLLDCYIFREEGSPTVMHFPLFNDDNCPGEAEEYNEQFSTFRKSYSKEEIEKLLHAAKENVKNVHQKILEEIRHIVDPPSANV
ncbi:cytosolic phospholipase A2 gamma-like [Tiliqua scincoides]|uniref:cytosolic phospholipase A2 gamma-like n=1 Tax=Tiliqua scincoides TaxID=71010 RepID=UPI00346202D0